MHQLWSYQDYVCYLTHSNSLIRRWAFKAIEERFPRRYTPEVAKLIGDSDEHLACAAPKYLAHHKAIDHAPAILESLLNDRGNIPGNCAIALGDMHYEPAVDVVIERLTSCDDLNTLLGLLCYLGKIRSGHCHQALREFFAAVSDDLIACATAEYLLDHRNPVDVPFVLEACFKKADRHDAMDTLLEHLMNSPGAGGVYGDLTEYSSQDILEAPKQAIEEMIGQHPIISPHSEVVHEIAKLIETSQYQHMATSLMFDAQKIVRSRFSEGHSMNHLSEISKCDVLALAFLEELSKRSFYWKRAIKNEDLGRNLISAVLACYFSIQEREGYLQALAPDATCEDLIAALKNTGQEFPKTLQERLVDLAPIRELKASLTDELLNWGDIWAVRLMGGIGAKAFVPDLIRVIRNADSLSYVHDEATRALNGTDESAHESILTAIQNGQLADAWDIFPLLEHLPYPESFDIAVRLWNEGDMDWFEIYAMCLEGIGDDRGIEALQDIFFEGNAVYIGDSLEVLAMLHNRDIPELPIVYREREAYLEKRERRARELNELLRDGERPGMPDTNSNRSTITTVRRETPKIGRNAPCPCGSGKKYKKCCLNKDCNSG